MRFKTMFLLLSALLLIFSSARADVSITIGKGDFYVNVGDYDYLPYGDIDRLPRVSFYDVMSDYGTWVTVSPFGRAWRPYVYYDWQPYSYGHWIYTQYGPTWEGYEPWAWAAYHYGNWIWSQSYGWVWIPGYQWHPGRVIWSYSYNTIGWMPAPPEGYNYFCGYLCPDRYYSRYSPYNRYSSYNPYEHTSSSDNDFGFEDYNDYEDYSDYNSYYDYSNNQNQQNYGYQNQQNYGYGNQGYYGGGFDPYFESAFRYDPYFYNPAYLRIAPRLWVFIPVRSFTQDDYSDNFFEQDFIRYLFDRRLVTFSRSELDRPLLERVVQQRITEEPVQVRELQTDRQPVKIVIPLNEPEHIRLHANRVIKEAIAPAFAEKKKSFKGMNARNRTVVTRVFKADASRQPQVETLDMNKVVEDAKQAHEQKRAKRQKLQQVGMDNLKRAEREGKFEHLNRARQKAERQEKRGGAGNNNQVREQKTKAPKNPKAFAKWEERESAKFNAWKNRQQEAFNRWKKLHDDRPSDVKRAEDSFQKRMAKADDDFKNRKRQAEQRFQQQQQ